MLTGYSAQQLEEQLMREIRYLDKLVDELAKGKAMEKILRNHDSIGAIIVKPIT